MCAGPVLGVPWPAKHYLSLQSLLIMQKSAQTGSPWVRLTQEHERGWSQACLWGGVWRWGPGTGGGFPWLPFRMVCMYCLSTWHVVMKSPRDQVGRCQKSGCLVPPPPRV